MYLPTYLPTHTRHVWEAYVPRCISPQVALWVSGNQLHQQRALGVYASEQEWRSVVHKRREAAGGVGELYLDRLLHALQQHHVRVGGGGAWV